MQMCMIEHTEFLQGTGFLTAFHIAEKVGMRVYR